jgi:hypothetical protein
MHEIDDSYGEGGIQLLWSAVALAAYGRFVHLLNVRAKELQSRSCPTASRDGSGADLPCAGRRDNWLVLRLSRPVEKVYIIMIARMMKRGCLLHRS